MIDRKGVLFCDGASKGNPGHSGIGIVLIIKDQKISISEYIGVATNNIAEYKALLRGIDEAKKQRVKILDIFTDSELLAKQIQGLYQVKSSNLKNLYEEVINLLKGFKKYTIKHIPRELNKEADTLANDALKKNRDPLK